MMMADKWELCIVSPGKYYMTTFHTEAETRKYLYLEFTKKFGVDPIQYLLKNGWEPFAMTDYMYYFRRKIEPGSAKS
jgi:hypothetical protein